MKLNEWLHEIVTPLFEKKDEADLFTSASALKEIEVPEAITKKFSETFLTRQRAFTDDEIVKKFNIDARGRVFDSVDLKLKRIMPKLSAEDQTAITAEPNTLLKLDMLEKALDNIKGDKDIAKINDAARKREDELHQKIKSVEDALKQKDDNFVKQINEVKVDYAVKNKLFAFDLAPEFANEKHKGFLADSTIHSLKKNFILEVDDKDPSIIHLRKNVDGQIVDHYEGNTKLTLDDVLKKEYEPYIKKSTAGDKSTQPPKTPTAQIPSDKPIVTLQDRIKASAQV